MIPSVSFQNASIYYGQRAIAKPSRASGAAIPNASNTRELLSSVWYMRNQLWNIEESMKNEVRLADANASGSRQAVYSNEVSLDLAYTAAQLVSTEELNTETSLATSFDPPTPTFQGSSTSSPTLGGVYDGTQGNDTLVFKVTDNGNVGGPYSGTLGILPSDLALEVRTSGGGLVDTIELSESDDPNTEYILSNGISVAFAAGTLELNDQFEITVAHSRVGNADSGFAMNGTGGSDANFDLGLSVQDGSFDVNGETIAVNASDSISDILDRITSSAANVNATFDESSDTISLINKTAGSEGQVILSNDTSGFFDAAKLSAASSTTGKDDQRDLVISSVGALSAIQTGNFVINGVTINIDRDVDTLNDILEKINSESESTGVTASYSGGRLSFALAPFTSNVVLSDGTSDFFETIGINIEDFTTESVGGKTGRGVRTAMNSLEKRFKEIQRKLAEFDESSASDSNTKRFKGAFQKGVASAIRDILWKGEVTDSGSDLDTKLGIKFNFSQTFTSSNYIEFDFDEMKAGMLRSPRLAMKFLFAEENNEGKGAGFFKALDKSLESLQKELAVSVGDSAGNLLVAYA